MAVLFGGEARYFIFCPRCTLTWWLRLFTSFSIVCSKLYYLMVVKYTRALVCPFVCCRPLLLLPSIFPSIRVFSNEPALCIRWPKYWSFHCFGVFHYTAVSQFILALMDNKFQFGAVISNAVKNFLSVYFVTQIFAFLGYMLDRHLRVELTAQTMHTFRHCHV